MTKAAPVQDDDARDDICAACGEPIEFRPGESYTASTDGKVWHLGCSPRLSPSTAEGVLRSALPVFERVTRLAHTLSCDVPITAEARKHIDRAYEMLAALAGKSGGGVG